MYPTFPHGQVCLGRGVVMPEATTLFWGGLADPCVFGTTSFGRGQRTFAANWLSSVSDLEGNIGAAQILPIPVCGSASLGSSTLMSSPPPCPPRTPEDDLDDVTEDLVDQLTRFRASR